MEPIEIPEENERFQKVGAEVGAVKSENGISDPDLRVIVEQWDSLPAAIKSGIVAMVQAAGGHDA